MRIPETREESTRLMHLCRDRINSLGAKCIAEPRYSRKRKRLQKSINRLLTAEQFYYYHQFPRMESLL